MNASIQKLLDIAIAEEGYLEKATNDQLYDKTANAGSGNWTKYAEDLDNIENFYNGKKNGYAWCTMFVDWCFVQAFGVQPALDLLCQPWGSYGAGVQGSYNYFNAKGQFHTSNPQPGDNIFFHGSTDKWVHTGLVYAVDSTTVYTVEGNTSSEAGVVENGGCVRLKSYSLTYSRIAGYGRPDWTIVETVSDDQKIWNFLLGKIGNEYGVAGLMGNLEAESGLYSDIVQGDIPRSSYSEEYTANVDSGAISEYDFVNNGPNGGGYGLAQWTYPPRKQALYDLWKTGGYDSIGSLDLALDFLWHELQTDYSGVLSVLKSATSIREASDKVLFDFENPADQSTEVQVKRASMGQAWYDKFHGSGTVDPDPVRPTWKPGNRKAMSLLLILASAKRT